MEPCCSKSEEEWRDFSDCFLAGEGRTLDGLGLSSCLNMCSLQCSNVLIEICLEKVPNGHRLLKWIIGNVFVLIQSIGETCNSHLAPGFQSFSQPSGLSYVFKYSYSKLIRVRQFSGIKLRVVIFNLTILYHAT